MGRVICALLCYLILCNVSSYGQYEDTSDHIQVTSENAGCGTITPEDVDLVPGGSKVTIGQIPWHAVIYDKTLSRYQGGTIITNQYIMTSLVSDERRAEDMLVAVGKVYRSMDDDRDVNYTQKFNVTEIFSHPSYVNYENSSISLVKLSGEIKFTKYIKPICLSFDHSLYLSQIVKNTKVKVAGWANNNNDPEMSALALRYVHHDKCDAMFGSKTEAVWCAQNPNNTNAVCGIDEGNGVAFPATASNRATTYYIQAVVRVDPRMPTCKEYTLMMSLYDHRSFLKEFSFESK